MSTLLELIDQYVEQIRGLPEDAADDESRYGDQLAEAKQVWHEIEHRLSFLGRHRGHLNCERGEVIAILDGLRPVPNGVSIAADGSPTPAVDT